MPDDPEFTPEEQEMLANEPADAAVIVGGEDEGLAQKEPNEQA